MISGLQPAAPRSPRVAPARWFAVWTRSQCEAKVEAGLLRRGLEPFLPRVSVPSRRRDRRVVLAQPLFPGYLFLRFTPSRDTYLRVAAVDGVVRVLGDGWDALHAIPEPQVAAVTRIVTTGCDVRPLPWLRVGDRVRITSGPLEGLEGLVESWRAGRATFVVSVDLLQRSVGVEVSDAVVRRI